MSGLVDPATVLAERRRLRVPAYPAVEVDPTGAGDVFATAFLAALAAGKHVYSAVPSAISVPEMIRRYKSFIRDAKLNSIQVLHPVHQALSANLGSKIEGALRAYELAPDLVISAETSDGVVMGIRHKTRPHCGLQFHPESVLTPSGKRIISNWVEDVVVCTP